MTHPGSKSLLASPAPKVAQLGVERQKPLQANFGQYFIFLFKINKNGKIAQSGNGWLTRNFRNLQSRRGGLKIF